MISTSTCNTLYDVLSLFFDRCFSIHPISNASRFAWYGRNTIIAYLIGPVIINGTRFLTNRTRMDHVTKRLNVTIEMARFKGGSIRQSKEPPERFVVYECMIHDSVMRCCIVYNYTRQMSSIVSISWIQTKKSSERRRHHVTITTIVAVAWPNIIIRIRHSMERRSEQFRL